MPVNLKKKRIEKLLPQRAIEFFFYIIGPTHKRTEGRAPAWGSEFTTKDATLRGDSKDFVPSLCAVDLGPVAARARVSVHKVLGRGAQTFVCCGARCDWQVFYRGAQADARGAAHVTAQVLDRGTQAVARGAAR